MVKPPDKPHRIDINPFDVLEMKAKELSDSALMDTNIESCQSKVRELGKILKDLANTQLKIGNYREQARVHNQSLRQASPKGKPAEGKIWTNINGKSFIFLDGRTLPYEGTPPDEENKEESQ